MLKMCFSNNYEDVRTKLKDMINHQSAINGRNRGEYDKTVTLEQKNHEFAQILKNEVAKLANVNMDSEIGIDALNANPSVIWAKMAIINSVVDYIIPDILIQDTGMFADTRYSGWGDSFSIDVKPNDLFYVSKAGRNGRRTEAQRSFDTTVTIVPENHNITVQTNRYRSLIGFDDMSEFVMKAALAIEAEIRVELYNVMNATLSALSTAPEGNALKVAGFEKKSAIGLAQRVTAWNGGSQAVFIGTKSSLADMYPSDAQFTYTENSDYFRLGHFRDYGGYRMVEMEQVAKWDDEYKLLLDDKKIFVISPTAQKLFTVCYEGTEQRFMQDALSTANTQETVTLNKSWGIGVATNAIGGVIELS